MNFELNKDAMPADFYRREVKVGDRRHLIFSSDSQIQLLKQARRWYIDGTFKVTRRPFSMLLSIHAFVRRGDCSKQVPLLYVLMSGRKTSDYIQVFNAVLRGLEHDAAVEEVVCDYEVALWKSVHHVFPEVPIRGCVFHWGQAVFRHVQSLGLATEYLQEGGTYAFIRKLLCLPFLPAEHIQPTFRALCDLNSATHLEPLLEYMDRTWFQSATWSVENLCVYGQSVRTNNDCEGWHRRLNVRAGISPPFYLLVKLLHREANKPRETAHLGPP